MKRNHLASHISLLYWSTISTKSNTWFHSTSVISSPWYCLFPFHCGYCRLMNGSCKWMHVQCALGIVVVVVVMGLWSVGLGCVCMDGGSGGNHQYTHYCKLDYTMEWLQIHIALTFCAYNSFIQVEMKMSYWSSDIPWCYPYCTHCKAVVIMKPVSYVHWKPFHGSIYCCFVGHFINVFIYFVWFENIFESPPSELLFLCFSTFTWKAQV